MESAESRLTELEIKLSYTEDLVETLNHAVFRQQEQIEALQRQLADLQRQMQSIPGGAARSLLDEVPPHY
ncbi:MAG: SlyX family protein [Rhodocyclales bacterium]|nr:SlyX family protein [Rhodocyclales bacterium]